jgi:hypothetical protein
VCRAIDCLLSGSRKAFIAVVGYHVGISFNNCVNKMAIGQEGNIRRCTGREA